MFSGARSDYVLHNTWYAHDSVTNFVKAMEDANNQPGTSKEKTIKSCYKVHVYSVSELVQSLDEQR